MSRANAQEFQSAFAAAFSAGAASAGLKRRARKTFKWTRGTGEEMLTVGFRLNRRNIAEYPGEFMAEIFWGGHRTSPRDTGEISFYQYALPAELDAIRSLHTRVVARFIAEQQLEPELANPGSLTRLMSDASDVEIRPNQNRWLPFWSADDAGAWGDLFGQSINGWISRFLANPETLEAWCWRVLWSKS